MNNTVKTNLSQSLTDAQKQQARTNIGCPDDSGLVHISTDEIISGVKVFTKNITVEIGDNSILFGLDSDGKAYVLHTDKDLQSTTSVVYYNSGSYRFTGKADSATTADSATAANSATTASSANLLNNTLAGHDYDSNVSSLTVDYGNGKQCHYYSSANWLSTRGIPVAPGQLVLCTFTATLADGLAIGTSDTWFQLGGSELEDFVYSTTTQDTFGGKCLLYGQDVSATIAWKNTTSSTHTMYPQIVINRNDDGLRVFYHPHTSVIVI